MSSQTDAPSQTNTPTACSASFLSVLFTTPIDPTASRLARWLAQQPKDESWNALHLSEKQQPTADTPDRDPRKAGGNIKDRDVGARL
jgi:hypothetical protein